MGENNKEKPARRRKKTSAEKLADRLRCIYNETIGLSQELASLVTPEMRSKVIERINNYTLAQLAEESDTLAELAQCNVHLQVIQSDFINATNDCLRYKRMPVVYCVLILLIQSNLLRMQIGYMDIYTRLAMTAFIYRLMPSRMCEGLNAEDALHTAEEKYNILLRGYYSEDMLSALDKYYNLDDTCFLSVYHAVPEENRQSYDSKVDELLASIESRLSTVEGYIPSESEEYWDHLEKVTVNCDKSNLQEITHTYQINTKAFLHLQICEAEFYDILLHYGYSWFPDETLEAAEAVQDFLRKLRDSARNHVTYCHNNIQTHFLPTAGKFKLYCRFWKFIYTEEFKHEAPKYHLWNKSEQTLQEWFRQICKYFHADDIANAILDGGGDAEKESSLQDIDFNPSKQESGNT